MGAEEVPADAAKPRSRRRHGRTDARIVRTADALTTALLALLDCKSFDQITVREITAKAGVSYATFFRHHPTKEALLDHVAADQIDRLVELTMPVLDTTDSLTAFTALCAHVEDHRTLWTALLTGGASGAMRDELLRIARDVAVDRAPRNGWLPVDLGVNCTVGLIVEVLTWWLTQAPDAWSIAQVATMLDRLVFSSTMPAATKPRTGK